MYFEGVNNLIAESTENQLLIANKASFWSLKKTQLKNGKKY